MYIPNSDVCFQLIFSSAVVFADIPSLPRAKLCTVSQKFSKIHFSSTYKTCIITNDGSNERSGNNSTRFSEIRLQKGYKYLKKWSSSFFDKF